MVKQSNLNSWQTLIVSILSVMLFWSEGAAKTQTSSSPKCSYLFVYFEGTGPDSLQEHIRFALSDDGISWTALNNNHPVLLADTIAESQGMRDPHIMRTTDGKAFLMVATDMKATRHGWTTNPGIVMMRSTDLIHWTHTQVSISRLWPEKFADVRYTWAPQTIYDPVAKRYVIYFTVIFKNEQGREGNNMVTYYSYANGDFTTLDTEPKILFAPKSGCIDTDIIHSSDGIYHMFYKGNIPAHDDEPARDGIMHTTSPSLLGPWTEATDFVDAYSHTNIGVEGSAVYQLIDGGYILQYDLFGAGRFEYQTSPDLRTFDSKPNPYIADFHPRHGYVMQITTEEAARLRQFFAPAKTTVEYSFYHTDSPYVFSFHFTHTIPAYSFTVVRISKS